MSRLGGGDEILSLNATASTMPQHKGSPSLIDRVELHPRMPMRRIELEQNQEPGTRN
jgi:hypothetical protein